MSAGNIGLLILLVARPKRQSQHFLQGGNQQNRFEFETHTNSSYGLNRTAAPHYTIREQGGDWIELKSVGIKVIQRG